MNKKPDLNIFRSLLFVFDIENPDNDSEIRQDLIASKNVNSTQELTELFDTMLKSEFLAYIPEARERCIKTLEYFLSTNDSFDSLFEKITTHFDDDVEDQRQFMQTLYHCLKRYNTEA
ncbi:hypothetical protein C1Y35_17665 [Pseudomonas sp. GW456-L14]|uniref:hypothetical protein n=1 Tax=unclassified Pseudomonas TaxID=196821 RepID=UPI000C88D9DE|nr:MULTISPECIES: hypothetical protein [unclassified Pseudomonas]PMY38294.1 hypothetical protein C1Y35_17665 [Pseudomonas sp. GW456-L14]PMY52782.1 hypothetical protein C1Y34_21410 [Pseudomonas sp. GW456-L12]